MWSYNYSDELYHHGIKGQRWGIRRYQNKDGTLTPAGKKRVAHEDYTKAHTKKSVQEMSDSELKSRLNRLQMEDNYNRLSNTRKSKGKKYVDKLIKAGTTVATVTTTALTIYNNMDKINKIVNKSEK